MRRFLRRPVRRCRGYCRVRPNENSVKLGTPQLGYLPLLSCHTFLLFFFSRTQAEHRCFRAMTVIDTGRGFPRSARYRQSIAFPHTWHGRPVSWFSASWTSPRLRAAQRARIDCFRPPRFIDSGEKYGVMP
jgi:hypothetical protein